MRESRSAASYRQLLQGLKYGSSSYHSPCVSFGFGCCGLLHLTGPSSLPITVKVGSWRVIYFGGDYLTVRRTYYCLLRQVVQIRDRILRGIARPQADWTHAEVWFWGYVSR